MCFTRYLVALLTWKTRRSWTCTLRGEVHVYGIDAYLWRPFLCNSWWAEQGSRSLWRRSNPKVAGQRWVAIRQPWMNAKGTCRKRGRESRRQIIHHFSSLQRNETRFRIPHPVERSLGFGAEVFHDDGDAGRHESAREVDGGRQMRLDVVISQSWHKTKQGTYAVGCTKWHKQGP